MEYTKFQYNIIKRERKDLVLIDVPDIDDVIVEFLKLNGVSITPKEVKREENFAKFSALLFIGAIITNYFLNDNNNYSATITPQDNGTSYVTGSVPQQTNFTPAAVMVGSQQMATSNKRAQWDNWKRWALDNKDFKKFKIERIDKVIAHNQKILKKLEKPSTQQEIKKILFPDMSQEMKTYNGSQKFQDLSKKYDGKLNDIKGPSVREDYINKLKPFKRYSKWAKKLFKYGSYFLMGYFFFLEIYYWLFVPVKEICNRWSVRYSQEDVRYCVSPGGTYHPGDFQGMLVGSIFLFLFGKYIMPFLIELIRKYWVVAISAYRSEKRKELHSLFDFQKYYQS